MKNMIQELIEHARFYREKGAVYLCKAEMCDSHSKERKEYTRRAAKALSMAEQYYRTAYHCAADIYGTDDASEMLLDDIGNNSKFIDRMIEEDD